MAQEASVICGSDSPLSQPLLCMLRSGPSRASHRVMKSGLPYDSPGSSTSDGSPQGRESSIPAFERAKRHRLCIALLAQHNFPPTKFSTHPVRQPVRMVTLDEIHGNFLHSIDSIDVVGINDRAEDFRGR